MKKIYFIHNSVLIPDKEYWRISFLSTWVDWSIHQNVAQIQGFLLVYSKSMYDPANHLKFWFQADHIFMDLLEDQLVEIIQFLVIFKWKLLRILLNNIRGSQICLQNLKRLNRLVTKWFLVLSQFLSKMNNNLFFKFLCLFKVVSWLMNIPKCSPGSGLSLSIVEVYVRPCQSPKILTSSWPYIHGFFKNF